MALSVGDRFGPYDVIAPPGAGGMGQVHRARDSRLGRQVALKIVSPTWFEELNRLVPVPSTPK